MKRNIVLLTVGCSNSTIAMKMLEQLGWNLGDADDQYAESVSVRRVNMNVMGDIGANIQQAQRAVATLPQPWALKDPRFADTMPWWKPVLRPYKPLLLWVTKDHEYVRASFKRRFSLPAARADQRLESCEVIFDMWEFPKIKLDADQISAAVRLFDPDRSTAYNQPNLKGQ